PLVVLVQLLRTDHMTVDPQLAQLALQSKTKTARFIHRVHFGTALLELSRPMQKRLLLKTLRRLGIAPIHLLDHHVKILVYINPKLDVGFAAIKLAAGSLV